MLISSAATRAQVLNINDAVQRTVDNYPLIRQRMLQVQAGKAHLAAVGDNKLPSLLLHDQLDMGTANAVQGAYFPLGIVPSLSGSNTVQQNSPNAGNVAISFLQWNFFNFGYYDAQRKEADAALAVNEAVLGNDTYQLSQAVINLYLDWLKKYRLMQVQQRNVDRASVTLTSIRATVNSGLKPGVDSATAAAVYADARIAYLEAVDAYNYDRITMGTYVAMPDGGLLPDTTLIANVPSSGQLLLPVADSVASDHPLLNVYQRLYEQQVAANNATARRYLPRIGLDGAAWVRNSGISPSGTYPPDGLSDGMANSKYNYLMGLTFTWNIVDLKRRHDELAEGNFNAGASTSAFQEQKLTLSRMMQQANSSYNTTQQKLREIPLQLNSAQQAYGQQLALYRSGLNTLVDVTNAQYVLQQAETNYVVTQDELLQLLTLRAGLSGQLSAFLQKLK